MTDKHTQGQRYITPGVSWSFDLDDQEVRDEADGSVLFDVHNATDAQAVMAAAAPLMLEALKNLMRAYTAIHAHHGNLLCEHKSWAQASAAIAAATGEDA